MKAILLLVGVLLANFHFAEAQQPTKIPRIGYVSGTGSANDQGPYVEALRKGLRDLRHVEGRTLQLNIGAQRGSWTVFPVL